ncbi:PAS-domain containing protein [Pseudomonas aeruginosa]|nr:PAS-domain containing protein [Pseudomonas aeruginosa]
MLELKASNQLLSDARLRAETAHQHLLDAIESISDAFVLFDPQQRIVLFNERFRALWIDSRARIGPGMRRAELHRLARSGGLIVEEQRGGDQQTLYRLRDERWLRMSRRPTRDGGLAVLYSDVTEIKLSETARREQALAQKSHLLQRAVDNLSQGVAMVGADGVLELWNRRFLELLRAGPDRRAPGLRRSHGGERIAVAHAAQPGLPGSPLSAREQRLFDGRVLEIRTHALPTGGFVNTFTDITERYRHAEALRASERWIRLITDQVPALIAYLSDELVYEFTNKVYEEWYRWPSGSMLGRCLRDVHGAEHCRRLEPATSSGPWPAKA